MLCALALAAIGPADGVTRMKRNVTQAVVAVADLLGNTPAISRRCDVHPAVIAAYEDGVVLNGASRSTPAGLKPEEAAVAAWLEGRAKAV